MGYTHYFSGKIHGSIDNEAIEKIKEIVDEGHNKNILCLEYNKPSEPPIVSPNKIQFNGIEDDGHETFCITTDDSDDFNFCKTARKPYDIYVQKVLLILQYYYDLDVSSDGDMYGEEWVEAMEWAENNLSGFIRPIEFSEEPSDVDLEHIAEQIKQGFTSGYLEGENYRGTWSIDIHKYESN